MVWPHPLETSTLTQRIARLEAENQRLKEVIGNLRDNECYLLRRLQLAGVEGAVIHMTDAPVVPEPSSVPRATVLG